MSDDNTPSQTLRAAFLDKGREDVANLLIEETGNLTRDQIIQIVTTGDWGGLSEGGILNLREISAMRVKTGDPIFPWDDEGFINAIINNRHGIFAY